MPNIHLLPLTRDPDYLQFCWQSAADMGCNGVHFSHRLCHDATDLTSDPNRAEEARGWVRTLRASGQDVWVWTHEIHEVPGAFLDPEGRLRFDEVDWQSYLRQKYDHFLTDVLPGITGLVFTFAETPFEVYKDRRVVSSLPPAERLAALMAVLVEICGKHGVKVALRDFVYRVDEVGAMGRALRDLPPEVIVMSKAVPHDWQPFYPPNPLLGAVGPREQWVEFDLGFEYEGQNMLPYANLEQTHAWVQAARDAGIRQVCLRLDRYDGNHGQSALSTPWGQLMLQAFLAWDADPATPLASIRTAWEAEQFPGAAEALRLATHSLQLMMFPRKNWLADHCRLPYYKYAKSHLVGGNADRLVDWSRDPEEEKNMVSFRDMPPGFREELEMEARESLDVFAEAARQLRAALPPNHPAGGVWEDGFRQLGSYLRLLSAYRDAFFRVREMEEHPHTPELAAGARGAVARFRATSAKETPLWAQRRFTGKAGLDLYGSREKWAGKTGEREGGGLCARDPEPRKNARRILPLIVRMLFS